jgi:glycerophosphoryl diester phosphodiesterase
MSDVRFFAHRGSSARYPEHTRAAYRQAVADGADGIECDVRLTSDGAVVCWHDATVTRTTGAEGRVDRLSLAELRRLDLLRGATVPAELGDPDEQLMTLPALLALVETAGRPLLLAIELKPARGHERRLVDAVLEVLDAAGWDRDTGRLASVQVSLMTFSVPTLDALQAEVTPALLVLLVEEDDPEPLALLDAGTVGAGPGIDEVRREPDRVRAWLARGSHVRVWTVNSVEDLDLCLELGVQDIITDRPAELRAALDRR